MFVFDKSKGILNPPGPSGLMQIISSCWKKRFSSDSQVMLNRLFNPKNIFLVRITQDCFHICLYVNPI